MTGNKKMKSSADDLLESLMEDMKQKNKDDSMASPEGLPDIYQPDLLDKNIDVDAILASPVLINPEGNQDKTYAIDSSAVPPAVPDIPQHLERQQQSAESSQVSQEASDSERTVAVTAFAKKKSLENYEEKVAVGIQKPVSKAGQVYTSVDASLAQADNLKIAQQRILQLEKELEKYRQENDDIASAAEIIRQRSDDLESRLVSLEKEKDHLREQSQSELAIIKGTLQFKETELGKARIKVDELENRLKNDFKRIRVKERELENRLELLRAEKVALLRAKDETILELQRQLDQIKSENENFRGKIVELNKHSDEHTDQIRRTIRALRVALANLENQGENILPIKKAE